MPRNKDEILGALSQNLEKAEIAERVEQRTELSTAIATDGEEDYAFAREHIRKLINTSDEAISTMLELASDSEAPRAYEVLATLLKNSADMNEQLLDIVKKRQSMHGIVPEKPSRSSEPNSVTNNAIFVGTTVELQKLLKNAAAAPPIDV